MSRRKQAKPRALKREDIEGFPDESTEEIGMELIASNGTKRNNLPIPSEIENSLAEESTLYDSSMETTIEPIDLENSPESELNGRTGTPVSWISSDTPEDQSLSPTSYTPLSDVDAESTFTIGVTESTPYACKFCDKAFPKQNNLKRHEQVHSDQLPFSCVYCQRLFKHKRSRDRHVKLHTGDRKYRCTKCESKFSRSDHLKIHMKTHDNGKPYQCTVCNRGYSTAAALTSHSQKHKKEAATSSSSHSPFGVYKCFSCPLKFSDFSELRAHVDVHSNELLPQMELLPKVKCHFCSDVFQGIRSLRLHIENKHTPHCPICLDTFASLEQLSRHKIVHKIHETQNPLTGVKCKWCVGLDHIYSPTSWKEHMREVHECTEYSRDSSTTLPSSSSPSSNPRISPDTANRTVNSPSGSAYSCQYCTMKFDSVESLQAHTVKVHSFNEAVDKGKSIDYVCSQCYKDFPNEFLLAEHLKRVHNKEMISIPKQSQGKKSPSRSKNSSPRNPFALEFPAFSNGAFAFPNPGPYLCNQCNAAFPDFESFRSHHKIHLDSGAQKYSCFECDGQFPTEEVLSEHVANHYLSISTEYGCQSCPKMFLKPDQLQRHLMDTHAHQLYQCALCKETFDSKVSIQVHFSMRHSDQCRTFKCTSCNSSFRAQEEFVFHVKIAHTKFPLFPCPMCNVSFPTEQLFQIHMQCHKKYPCIFCPEQFPVEFLLDRHVQEKHSRDNALPLLSREMENAENLSLKLNLKVDENSFDSSVKKQLRCDMCDISFTIESSLIVHRRQAHNIRTSGSQKPGHTTLSLFCAYCKESCKSRTELENHLKSHVVSPSKHKCNICDEICPSAATLAEHKLEHCKVITDSTCVICHTTIEQEDHFHSHFHQHNNHGLPASCVICRQTLMSDVEIQVHAKHHTRTSELSYICCVCGRKGSIQQLIITGTQDSHTYMCKDCFHAKGDDSRLQKTDDLRCQICKIKFESILELESHKLSHHNTYHCMKCQVSFDTVEKIQCHVHTHVIEEGTDHVCHICKSVFDSPAKLQCHLIEHEYDGHHSYSCYMCKAVFTTAQLIQQHMFDHSMDTRPYACALCHQKFFFKSEWENHSFCHPEYPKERNFTCSECNMNFTSHTSYQNHCKLHENKTNNASSKCSLCPEVFSAPEEMQRHYFETHVNSELSEKKNFPCTDCDEVFPCKSNLQGHQRVHSLGAKHKCPTCKKAFSMSKNLTIHMRTHTGVRPYECPICSKKFARKENRKAHMKSHAGKKPYLCPHCGKRFSRSCHAKEHIRIHATSTTHPCEVCSETFPSTAALKHHLMSAHEKHFDYTCSVCNEVFENTESLDQHMLKEHDVRTSNSSPMDELSGSSVGQSSSSVDMKELDSSEYSSNIDESDTRDSSLSIIIDKEEHSAPAAQTVM